jgi:6-pyruvoyltetrahydropterin/6-carboxytetrahydropterin synthase
MHGYALRIRLDFEADRLDNKNWVVDFGSLKPFKVWLEEEFDHKTLVATDDPNIKWFEEAEALKIIDPIYLKHVGCEFFADHILGQISHWLNHNGYSPRVRVTRVEVSEHSGNSAWVRIND